MGWDGSGNFVRSDGAGRTGEDVCQQQKGAGVSITASLVDAELNEIVGGLENCLTRDGQNTPTQNLPMNGKKHTGVAVASSGSEYAAASQIASSSLTWGSTSTGSANTHAVSLPVAPTSYSAGLVVVFVAGYTNTSNTTLNVNGLGAKYVKTIEGEHLYAGAIVAGDVYLVVYDGTKFVLMSAGGGVNVVGDIETAGSLTGASLDIGSGDASGGSFRTNGGTAPYSAQSASGDTTYGNFHSESTSATSPRTHASFWGAGAKQGSIVTSGGSTQYNTTSDRRLKKNIKKGQDLAVSIFDEIECSRFLFSCEDPESFETVGFIAQEVKEVYPKAVHDPRDADAGIPEELSYMSIDTSKLVGILWGKVKELESRVIALENNKEQ